MQMLHLQHFLVLYNWTAIWGKPGLITNILIFVFRHFQLTIYFMI